MRKKNKRFEKISVMKRKILQEIIQRVRLYCGLIRNKGNKTVSVLHLSNKIKVFLLILSSSKKFIKKKFSSFPK